MEDSVLLGPSSPGALYSAPRPRRSVVLALVSKKGGVGKTTTAVTLAAALAREGRKVLLIDLDSQASASLSIGLSRDQFSPGAADVLLGELPLAEAIHSTSTPGLHVVPASADLISADFELGGFRHKEVRLVRRLEPVRDDYDFVFLDCAPSLSLLAVNALVAADGFIVPAAPQYLAIQGLENLLDGVDRLTARVGRRTPLVGVLLTMVDYRLRATRDNVDEVRRRLGRQVFAVEIRINVRLAEAPASGEPIFDYAPEATGARAYELLTEELLLRCRSLLPAEPAPAAAVEPR